MEPLFIKVKNTGKGFLTARDRLTFNIAQLFEDYWVMENSPEAIEWATNQRAERKTKSEMLALYQAWRDDPANLDPITGEKPTVTIPDEFLERTQAEKQRAKRAITIR